MLITRTFGIFLEQVNANPVALFRDTITMAFADPTRGTKDTVWLQPKEPHPSGEEPYPTTCEFVRRITIAQNAFFIVTSGGALTIDAILAITKNIDVSKLDAPTYGHHRFHFSAPLGAANAYLVIGDNVVHLPNKHGQRSIVDYQFSLMNDGTPIIHALDSLGCVHQITNIADLLLKSDKVKFERINYPGHINATVLFSNGKNLNEILATSQGLHIVHNSLSVPIPDTEEWNVKALMLNATESCLFARTVNGGLYRLDFDDKSNTDKRNGFKRISTARLTDTSGVQIFNFNTLPPEKILLAGWGRESLEGNYLHVTKVIGSEL